jgi:hypothetical protein
MPRRIFVPAKRIWAARAFWYADHFEKRARAESYPQEQAVRVLKACEQMPEPFLDLDGSLDDWSYWAARAKPVEETIQLTVESGIEWTLLVKWYWTGAEWDNFVKMFNDLPEPEPMYEVVFRDGRPKFEVVHNPLCTSRVQRLYKPAVVPIPKENPQDRKICTPKKEVVPKLSTEACVQI